MCGVCGWIRLAGIELNALMQMNRLVSHRGPDGEAYWLWDGQSTTSSFIKGEVAEYKEQQGIIGLGHRRLAILDLSDSGLQPMSFSDGRIWIVFNGEIYNYLELRNELTQLGYQFHTGTDTEVILASYDRWGTECFGRFNGMWGLAIVDLRKRVLVLSRDRLGIKPLYVWHGDYTFAFASEIKQFFALPVIKARANMDAVIEYIDTGYEAPPATFFQDIQAFPPGSWAEVSIDRPYASTPQPFWFPENITLSKVERREAREQTRRLFEDSVKLQLRSDVPVGVCLSGGLDSSAVLGQVKLLQSQSGASTYAFSAAFDDPRYDERKYIELMLQAFDVNGSYAFPRPRDFLNDFASFIFHHDEPPGSLSQFAGWSVMRLARNHHVPVLLNGQGGDELFSGYWHVYYLFLWQKLLHSPWSVVEHLSGALLPGGNPSLVLELLPHLRKYQHRKNRNNRTILHPCWQSSGFTLNNNWAISSRSVTPLQYRMHEIRYIHLPRLLKWDDRNSMAFSVEGRYPFLDHRLVEWAVSLPPEMNLKHGWNKLLIRESLANNLPSHIQWRRSKIGFETPQSEWIRTTLCPVIARWARSPSERLQGIVDKCQLRHLTDELLQSKKINKMDERHFLIIRLFFLDQWLGCFNIEF